MIFYDIVKVLNGSGVVYFIPQDSVPAINKTNSKR